jgi:hypothetical protein
MIARVLLAAAGLGFLLTVIAVVAVIWRGRILARHIAAWESKRLERTDA